MKKRLLWIAALLMAAGCSDTNEEQLAPNGETEPEFTPEIHYVRVGAATDGDVRASYDENLRTYWETGDRMLALMGLTPQTLLSGYNRTYTAGTIALESGAGTNEGIFAGSLETPWTDKGDQYFHFAYPAEAGTLTLRANSGFNAKHPATCSITIPAEQSGRWVPYMWATTGEKSSWDKLAHVKFNILNGSLAIRAYENDRTTTKQLSAVTIRVTGSGSLVGTYTATTNDSFANAEFQLTNAGQTLTATGLERLEKVGGLYEYRLNVVPGEVDGLELTLTGADGTVVTRRANAKTFRANTRSGLNVYWDDATITMDRATSWFEDQSLEGGLLYLQATVAGTTAVEEIGYTLDGTDHPVSAATALDERIALPAGKYVVGAYAKVNGKTIRSESKETIVTPVPTLTNAIRSSCTNNGLYRTTNSLEGNRIEVSYTLSDPFFTEVLSSVELVCDEGTLLDLLKESVYVASDLRTCKGCRAVAELQNGYRIEGTPYDTTLSGIPCDYQFYGKNDSSLGQEGWITSRTKWNSSYLDLINNDATTAKRFCMPEQDEISYELNLKYYYYVWNFKKRSATIYAGASASQNGPSDNASAHTIESNANAGQLGRTNLNGSVLLEPGKAWFMISHNNPDASGNTYLGLHTLHLQYAHPDE